EQQQPELPVALLLRHPDALERLQDTGVGGDVAHGVGASSVGVGVGAVGSGVGICTGTGARALARRRSVMATAPAYDRAWMCRTTYVGWYEGRLASRMNVSFTSVDSVIGPRSCCTPR